jgi:hypothetical protein
MWHGMPIIASAQLGVLEFLPDNAPARVLAGLSKPDFAAAFDDIASNRAAWASRGRAYRGVLMPRLSGSGLISRFSAVLGAAPSPAPSPPT